MINNSLNRYYLFIKFENVRKFPNILVICNLKNDTNINQ